MESHAVASLLTQLQGKDLSAYSFVIELGTWSSDAADASWILAAISGTETYANLTGYIGQPIEQPGAQIWTPGAYSAPEPTSGILTLIGLALLGIKGFDSGSKSLRG